MKNIIVVVVVIICAFSVDSASGDDLNFAGRKANRKDQSGDNCGENCYWHYDSSTLTLTVSIPPRGSGVGYMSDFSDPTGYRWYGSTEALYNIVINETIKSIGNNTFRNCKHLQRVEIQPGVERIGEGAFMNSNLNNVTFGEGVVSIEKNAFYGCQNLKVVTIPKSVTSIGEGAFGACSSLERIDVEPGDQVFESVDGVLISSETHRLLLYPEGKDENYTIPDGVKSIDAYAFSKRKTLKRVVIRSTVEYIGDSAFSDCGDLEDVVIPSNLKYLGNNSFENCKSLKRIVIPSSVEYIGYNAFQGCSGLSSIYYLGTTLFKGSFFSYEKVVENICVPPDYSNTTFLSKNVTSDTDECLKFRSMYNKCFKANYSDGKIYPIQREEASEWEAQQDLCVEYHCVNESGNSWWSYCNSSKLTDRVCINDECYVLPIEYEDMRKIELEIEGMKTTVFDKIDKNNMIEYVSATAGIKQGEMSVGVRVSEGEVLRISYYLKDEQTTNKVLEALKEIFNLCGLEVPIEYNYA